MATKKKAAAEKKKSQEIKKTDADSRPCLDPEKHVNVCHCYGVEIHRGHYKHKPENHQGA